VILRPCPVERVVANRCPEPLVLELSCVAVRNGFRLPQQVLHPCLGYPHDGRLARRCALSSEIRSGPGRSSMVRWARDLVVCDIKAWRSRSSSPFTSINLPVGPRFEHDHKFRRQFQGDLRPLSRSGISPLDC